MVEQEVDYRYALPLLLQVEKEMEDEVRVNREPDAEECDATPAKSGL